MKKLMLILLSCCIPALAQNPDTQALGGNYYASQYGYWSMRLVSGNGPSVGPTVRVNASTTAPKVGVISPFVVGDPILFDTGLSAETLVITAATNCYTGAIPNTCVVTAPFTKTHYTGALVQSGTYGLQEAINAALQAKGGTVVVDSSWRGTTAMITGANGNASVAIADMRSGVVVNYAWNGTAYAVAGGGGGGGGGLPAQSISVLAFSPSDSSVAATWKTLNKSDSHLTCGGKVAVDDGFQTGDTFHQAIVTGLTAGTVYSCTVTSGATTSTPQNVTTLAAQTRTAITNVTFGTSTSTGPNGDTFYNFVSNDGLTYITEDDGNGFAGGTGASQNMQIARLTNEATLNGTPVNLLTNYGVNGQLFGTAGPGGAGLAHKFSGLFGMGGVLFGFETANNYARPQVQWFGNIIASRDHGGSWNNFVSPPALSPNGLPLNPVGTFEFGISTWGWCNPVRYAMDDGSIGYTTPGNRIDGADGYVYGSCTDGGWDNSSNLFMWRIPRVQMLAQNPAALQYWSGGTPTVTSFVNDANWTAVAASATAIYTAVNQTSAQDEVFVPALNYYLLLTWYHPDPNVSSNTVWVVNAGPTPAGPWTQVTTLTNNPSGWYNPTVLHRTVATNVATANINLSLVYAGDYGAGSATYYHPSYSTLTLNPVLTLLLDSTPPATFAGSVAHSLKASYVGPLVRIQRASDNTQIDVGQASTLLNQATVNTFCAGTTCNVATLYNHTGAAPNCTQSTFANMPILYTGGAIQLDGGKPTMRWDNTSRWLNCPVSLTGSTYEGLAVANMNSGVVSFGGVLILNDGTNSGGSNPNSLGLLGRHNNFQFMGNTSIDVSGGAAFAGITYGQQFLADATANLNGGGATGIGIDGGTMAVQTVTSPSPLASTQITIGSDLPTNTYFWFGTISDVVLYPSQLSGPQRTSAHSIESAFFGTP